GAVGNSERGGVSPASASAGFWPRPISCLFESNQLTAKHSPSDPGSFLRPVTIRNARPPECSPERHASGCAYIPQLPVASSQPVQAQLQQAAGQRGLDHQLDC